MPFIIFPYTRLPVEVVSGTLPDIEYNYNSSGWMTGDNFAYYIRHVLYKQARDKGVKFPIVLFVDNHSSHISEEISRMYDELQIILVCLYPNSTHVVQPLDIGVFYGLKRAWARFISKSMDEQELDERTVANKIYLHHQITVVIILLHHLTNVIMIQSTASLRIFTVRKQKKMKIQIL